ncbi:50S ribosomal protein L29, partial [Candidatus Bathyarchaeota archaeon]|nr:50S ribosomal protein L29 [Candidatus Bathyarchaeota archaeon]
MPIVRMKEIRGMTSEQRQQKLEELRTELSKMRTLINAGGSVENPGRVRALRKSIAQLKT